MRGKLVLTLTTAVMIAGGAPPAHAARPPGDTWRVTPLRDVLGLESDAGWQTLSGDGRFVGFVTAHPLVTDDTNTFVDVYVTDTTTGEVERVSLTNTGGQGNGNSTAPSLSDDGRFVAFQSSATNHVSGDTNGSTNDIFVRDRLLETTTIVSVSSGGTVSNGNSSVPKISGDGKVVAFASAATNLVADDTNGAADIFVRNLAQATTVRASVSSGGSQAAMFSEMPAIDGTGRHVAFRTQSPNLVPGDTNPANDIFVRDLVAGTTERVSVSSDGSEGLFASFYPYLSSDGRYVSFGSFSENFASNDMNGAVDAFVHDRATGVTERILVGDRGTPDQIMGTPVISDDGRFVTGNVLGGPPSEADPNGSTDVWVYDRLTGASELVSVSTEGIAGNAISHTPAISGDGRRILFFSQATDLTADGQGGWALYLRDVGPSLGVGSLAASRNGGTASVTGWARTRGQVLAAASESSVDAGPFARAARGELVSVRAVYRPEQQDLGFRVEFAPSTNTHWPTLVGTDLRKPSAVVYTVGFSAGARFEARAINGPDGHRFELYRCAPSCELFGPLTGSIGYRGDAVTLDVPLQTIGLEPGQAVSFDRVTASFGTSELGALHRLDEMAFGATATVPATSVTLGAAAPGTPAEEVAFTAPADLAEGRFTRTLEVQPGDRVWARVCLGQECGVASTTAA